MTSISKEDEATRERALARAAEDAEHELPSYDSHRAPPPFTATASASSTSNVKSEQSYTLVNSKGKTWLTLVVKSRAPASAKALPVFKAGDEITGTVLLSLDKVESFKGITVSVSALI